MEWQDEWLAGFEGGRLASASLKRGDVFIGAMPYADTVAERGTHRWRGAMHGYLSALPGAIVVDAEGRIVRFT